MSKLLISCKNISEVSKIKNLVDIIDLKNPDIGSLGAWKIEEILNVTKQKKYMPLISATLGNFKNIDLIINRLKKFDKLGLDYIKFGIFSSDQKEIDLLIKRVVKEEIRTRVVAVLFADTKLNIEKIKFNLIKFKKLKINHVMLDTQKKNNQGLLQIYNEDFLKDLVEIARLNNINIGFAGQLKEKDLAKLINFNPYLCGIRTAACFEMKRKNEISKTNVEKMRTLFNC
tara:strand:- start:648 stop:1334 length:687 start_codon:yes stop_codon:yes gene_type:complete